MITLTPKTSSGNENTNHENKDRKQRPLRRHWALLLLLIAIIISIVNLRDSNLKMPIFTSLYQVNEFNKELEQVTGNTFALLYVEDRLVNFTCNIPLNESWNLISSPCLEENTSISYATRTTMDYLLSIHTHNGTEPFDIWKSYHPYMPIYVRLDLNNFSMKKGYWINVNHTVNLTMVGDVVIPYIVELDLGWNLIGWRSNETKNITIALSGIANQYTSVHTYFANDSSDPWKVYNPNLDPSLSDLKYIEPYRGYWINMTESSSLKVI
jgi:hypothetical protein